MKTEFFRENIRIVLLFAVLAFLFTLPIFRNFSNWGIQDWDAYFFNQAVIRSSVLEYRQFPLWNPYYCGGAVSLANPQFRFLSPFFLLTVIFGVIQAAKIEIWLHLVIGMWGMYRLVRYWQGGISAALVSAFVFMLNSMYALNLTVGMPWFFSVAYLPWAFLFFLRSFSELKYAVLAGFCILLMFFGGGTYVFAITTLFLAFYSFFLVCSRQQTIKITARVLLVIVFVIIGLGAVKLFPCLEFFQRNPRQILDFSGYSLGSLIYSWFGRDQSIGVIERLSQGGTGFLSGMSYAFDENGMYIGILPFMLFLLGIIFYFRRRLGLALSFIFFLWLGLGHRVPVSLWLILREMPVYGFMRVAQRFRIIFMLCLAVFAGLGFQRIIDYLSEKCKNKLLVQLFVAACLLFIAADLCLVNSSVWQDAFTIAPLKTTRSDVFFQTLESPALTKDGLIDPNERYMYGSWGSLYPCFLSNVGVIMAEEAAHVPRKTLHVDSPYYRGEIFILDTLGRADFKYWSPNKFIIELQTEGDGYLIINQNYYPGWHVKGDRKRRVENLQGLLALKVTAGDKELVLYYLPTSFIIGAWITLITAILLIVFWLRWLAKRQHE